MTSKNTVHVIDPDESIGEALSALLGSYQIEVRSYATAEIFLESVNLENDQSGCLLVESNLPGLSGLALLEKLCQRSFSLPVILLTDFANSNLRRQALRFGAADVLEKPLMDAFLLERLTQLLPGKNGPEVGRQTPIKLADGTPVVFRAMRPSDASIEEAFVQGLSTRKNHFRFFSAIRELTPDMLRRFTTPEFPGSDALVAIAQEGDKERQLGVARYLLTVDDGVAEFSVVVADEWQGIGIATHLISGLTAAATVAGVNVLEGWVLSENTAMLNFAKKMGFVRSRCEGDTTLARIAKVLHETH